MLEDEMQALKTTIESSLQTRLCFLHAMGLLLLFFKDPPAVIKVNERGPPHVASWVHILSGKVVTTKQPHFTCPFRRKTGIKKQLNNLGNRVNSYCKQHNLAS